MRYCTLYLNYNNRLKTTGTNVEQEHILRLEDYINELYIQKCDTNDADAFVLRSETPLNYETAWEREIRYWCDYANNRIAENNLFTEEFAYRYNKGKILQEN